MKRYDCLIGCECGRIFLSSNEVMSESEDGEFVKWEDIAKMFSCNYGTCGKTKEEICCHVCTIKDCTEQCEFYKDYNYMDCPYNYI
jgi:hypothetical protein